MTTLDLKRLETILWQYSDTLRADSNLKFSEYLTSVLGLIFLRFVDSKYSQFEAEIKEE